MATTLQDVLSVAEGNASINRGPFTQSIVNFAIENALSDNALLKILHAVLAVQPRLVGATARLKQDQRIHLFHQLQNRSLQDGDGRALVVLFALECAGHPIEQAILGILEDMLGNSNLQANGIAFLKRALGVVGLSIKYSDALLHQISKILIAASGDISRHIGVLTFLGFKMSEPVEHRQPIFQHVVLPLLTHIEKLGAADAALMLEQTVYSEHIKALERPDHHRDCFFAMAKSMRALAMKQANMLTPLKSVNIVGRPRVAFFLHNGHRLAHVEVLLSFLSGLMGSDKRPIEPFVYLLAENGYQELAAVCQKMGVCVVAGDLPAQTPITKRFARCRQQLSERGIAAVVFVSVPQHLEYLSALKLAPVSIWWSMKFPLPNFPMLDGRAFYRLLFPGKITIEDQVWFGGPLGLTFPTTPDPKAVEAVRSTFAGGPILGTVAREEKIREPAYLQAVVQIMQLHPTASFLWTGRQQLPEITRFFEEKGIGDRCHFLGWVDPAIYCRVFDVFLETFPLTGLMSGWAMAAGQAVVTAGSLGWLGTYLAGIYDETIPCTPAARARLDDIFAAVKDRVPFIWAQDAPGFIELASVLILDPALRRDFGLCCQRFMQEFLADEIGSALSQAEYFADVARLG